MSEKSAKILRDFIARKNWTNLQFAQHAGISRYSIQKYLKGSRIHPKTAKRMEDNLKDNAREFLPFENLID